MTKKMNKTAKRQLSSDDLRDVRAGLLPRGAMYDLNLREVRQDQDKARARRWLIVR